MYIKNGMLNPIVFKRYDIRGVVPTEIDGPGAEIVAQAFAELLQRENPGKILTIAVGGDMRLMTPELKSCVIKGLTSMGVDAVDIGLVSTPTFYFAVAYYGYDGGIQVSASHNPKQFNGLKMVRSGSRPIGEGMGMEEIKDLALKNEIRSSSNPGKVSENKDVLKKLVELESQGIDRSLIKPFTVVVDAANAMGSLDVEAMFEGLPCKLIRMNFTLDGTFPSHQPDPLDPSNLKILQSAVIANNADLGISPDGDGDRYFFVDERGEIIRQEILRGIMAQEALKEHPGATVCYDIRPGRITREMIEAAAGKGIVTPVGHSLIKARMLELGAVFGGESSGHYFYKFPFGTFEAPVTLVLKFLIWLSEQNRPLSEVIAPYRKYFHSGEINSEVKSIPDVLERVKQKYADAKIDLLDGVSVEYPDYWFNLRGSNTEPLIRLNLEATSAEVMQQKRDEVLAVIRQK